VDVLILYLSYASEKIIKDIIPIPTPNAAFRRYLCFGNWQEILFDALGQQRLYFEYVSSGVNPLWEASSYLHDLPMAKLLNDSKLPSEFRFPIRAENAIGNPYNETMVEQFIWVGKDKAPLEYDPPAPRHSPCAPPSRPPVLQPPVSAPSKALAAAGG